MMSPFYEMAFMECCFLEILDIAVTTIKQTHFDRNKSQVIKIPTKHSERITTEFVDSSHLGLGSSGQKD